MDRKAEELEIIKEKFAPYFIVVRNMIQWSKKNDIVIGPGVVPPLARYCAMP